MIAIQEGAQSDSIKDYKLPVVDTDTARRNFPGYEEKQWYSLDEIRDGDFFGTTDTDAKTDVKDSYQGPYQGKGGYSKINRKAGANMRGFKSSSPRTKSN